MNNRLIKTITCMVSFFMILSVCSIKADTAFEPLVTAEEVEMNYDFIYNITKALSDIVYTEYDTENGELARGRAFGTKGEHKAADILKENLSALGFWTYNETIENSKELPNVATALWVNDYKILLNNTETGEVKEIEGYASPTCKGPRGDKNNKDYNFSFTDLKLKPQPERILPFGKNIRKIINKEDYAFFTKDSSYDPYDKETIIQKILGSFLSPYSDFTLFYDGVKNIINLAMMHKYYPKCQAQVRYDITADTYNMINSGQWSLPVIFINGTVGQLIKDDPDQYKISFYLDQKEVEQVESYNVIGQLNGTDSDKIVIIDCLYDGWWCQATADSAIGMGMIMGIAKWFADNNITPKYTIRFIGFGGEEHGFRGATAYQNAHKDENIIYVFDLNQLAFNQTEPLLYLDFLANDKTFLDEIFEIAQQADYKETTGNAGIRKYYMPRGAPSDDQPFARNQKGCKTICFLKGKDWVLHHRTGDNHTEGDSMKYYDPVDVKVTVDIILDIVKYFTID